MEPGEDGAVDAWSRIETRKMIQKYGKRAGLVD